MQDQVTRMYRVQDVAEMYAVSVSTIRRAIDSGQLHALRFGTGRGLLRIPASALAAFEKACELTARADVATDLEIQAGAEQLGEVA